MEFLVRSENRLPVDTPDPAALHDALMSLPMAPWLDVHVEALATHPQERT